MNEQLICRSCPNYKQRLENFSALKLSNINSRVREKIITLQKKNIELLSEQDGIPIRNIGKLIAKL